MKQYTTNITRGFTIVELLVVISIIAILTTILTVNFNDARVEAQNKAVQTELKELQLALELYKAQNDVYPADLDDLVPEFIAKTEAEIEATSGSDTCDLDYEINGAGWYKVTAENCHAGDSAVSPTNELARCPSTCSDCDGNVMNVAYFDSDSFAKSYGIYSAGGQCD